MDKDLALADECGMKTQVTTLSIAWKYDPDSRLLALAKDVYKAQNGEDVKVVAVHAGVECGTFKAVNPDLDIISIGADLSDGHSTGETFRLATLPKVWHFLEGILQGIGQIQ